jgi:N-acetylmuramoyl-L-alanine amidase
MQGADTGAQGNGLFEQSVTLAIARRIKPLLEAHGITVVMTRDTTYETTYSTVDASLAARVKIAENSRADLFVSIHCNAGGGTGSEVYVCATGGQAEKLAKILAPELSATCGWANRGVKVNAKLYVLNSTSMPAILSESGFIDNVTDAVKLNSDLFLQKIANAHAYAICEWAGIKYDTPSAPTPDPTPTPETPQVTKPPVTGDAGNITFFAGGGWAEFLPERVIIHYSTETYICIWADGRVTSHARGRQSENLV